MINVCIILGLDSKYVQFRIICSLHVHDNCRTFEVKSSHIIPIIIWFITIKYDPRCLHTVKYGMYDHEIFSGGTCTQFLQYITIAYNHRKVHKTNKY